jgi:hypothetical protein
MGALADGGMRVLLWLEPRVRCVGDKGDEGDLMGGLTSDKGTQTRPAFRGRQRWRPARCSAGWGAPADLRQWEAAKEARLDTAKLPAGSISPEGAPSRKSTPPAAALGSAVARRRTMQGSGQQRREQGLGHAAHGLLVLSSRAWGRPWHTRQELAAAMPCPPWPLAWPDGPHAGRWFGRAGAGQSRSGLQLGPKV